MIEGWKKNSVHLNLFFIESRFPCYLLVIIEVGDEHVHVVLDGELSEPAKDGLQLLPLGLPLGCSSRVAANGTRLSLCIIQMFLYQRFHRFYFIFSFVCFHRFYFIFSLVCFRRFFLYSPLDSQQFEFPQLTSSLHPHHDFKPPKHGNSLQLHPDTLWSNLK